MTEQIVYVRYEVSVFTSAKNTTIQMTHGITAAQQRMCGKVSCRTNLVL